MHSETVFILLTPVHGKVHYCLVPGVFPVTRTFYIEPLYCIGTDVYPFESFDSIYGMYQSCSYPYIRFNASIEVDVQNMHSI